MNIASEKYISACDRLYTFSSNKRLSVLDNEFIQSDDIGKIAKELIQEINSEHGLNLFELSDRNKIMLFEEILTEKISQFSFENYLSPDEILEEEKLFKRSVEIPNDYLKKFNFNKNDLIQKRFKISFNDIKSIVYNPHKINAIEENQKDNDVLRQYFLTSIFNIFNKKKIVLIGVTPHGKLVESSNSYVNKSKSGIHLPYTTNETAGKIGAYANDKSAVVVSLMLAFDYDSNKEFLDYPLRLFFKALDLYGTPLTINNQTKTFYKEVILSRSLEKQFLKHPFSILKIEDNEADVEGPYVTSVKDDNNLRLLNIFCINIKMYLDDLKSFKI